MTKLVCLAGFASAFLSNASSTDPVRRSNQKASPSDVHCVVWGDGPYNGMKFQSESEADERFKQAQREELVAVHYDRRFREVQRFQSARVKAVRWVHLADWCKENNNVEEPSAQNNEVGVGAGGKVENFMAQPTAVSLLAADTTEAVGIKASSNLVGTVGTLEKELVALASKASKLFNEVGQADPMSGLKLGDKDAKLKTRVSNLERYLSTILGGTKTLEEEITGAVGSAPSTSQSSKGKVSIKGKIEALLPKADNLKRRMLVLERSSVISEIGRLEGKVASYLTKAASLTQSLGLEKVQSEVAIAKSTIAKPPMSTRIATLDRLVAEVQHSTNKLGYEVLERSFAESTAPAKLGPLKVRVDSLIPVVEDLDGRFSALETGSLNNFVDTLEEKVSRLHSKMMEVSKRIGSEAHLDYQDTRMDEHKRLMLTTTNVRVAALEKYVSDVQQKLESVEEELLGTSKNLHKSMGETHSMKGRILSMTVQVDGLLDRVNQLEKEV